MSQVSDRFPEILVAWSNAAVKSGLLYSGCKARHESSDLHDIEAAMDEEQYHTVGFTLRKDSAGSGGARSRVDLYTARTLALQALIEKRARLGKTACRKQASC